MNGGIDNMKTCVNVLYLQSRRWLAWHGAVYIFISEHAMAWCVPLCESVWYEYVCEPPPHQPSPFLPYTHTYTQLVNSYPTSCMCIYLCWFFFRFVRSLVTSSSFFHFFISLLPNAFAYALVFYCGYMGDCVRYARMYILVYATYQCISYFIF